MGQNHDPVETYVGHVDELSFGQDEAECFLGPLVDCRN